MNSISRPAESATPTPASPDRITVLTCAEPGKRCAKRYTDPTKPPDEYDAGFWFKSEAYDVANLDDLASLLEDLRGDSRSMIIRGRLRDEVPPDSEVARRSVERKDEGEAPAAFTHCNHFAIMVDADSTETTFDASDRLGSIERWRAALPVGLRSAALIFQFSAKQHLSKTVRGHAWFWCAERFDDGALRAWALKHGFDSSLYTPVQPHYTADPIFEGCADPLAPRALIRLAGDLARLDITSADLERARDAATKSGNLGLDELGEPDDTPEAVNARAKICDPLRPFFREKGKKFPLCGAIGGACAKAGLPPEETDAIVSELLSEAAGDDSDCNVDAGRARALGAYDLEDVSKALGLKGIAELTARADGKTSLTAHNFLGALESYASRFKLAAAETERAANDTAAGEAEGANVWAKLPLEFFDASAEPEPLDYVALCFAAGKVNAIVAYAYRSKTPFALLLGLCIAAGVPFLGHVTKRRKVLYVAHEGQRNARRKAARLARGLGFTLADLADWFKFASAPSGALTPEYVTELERACTADGFGVVIVDTYGSALDPAIDRNSAAFSAQLKQLGDMSERTGIVSITLLHERKTQRGATGGLEMIDGHNSVAGALQGAITLSRPDEDDPNLIEVRCTRAPDEEFQPFTIRWEDATAAGQSATTPGDRLSSPALTARVVAEAGEKTAAEQTTERLQAIAPLVLDWLSVHRADGSPALVSDICTQVQRKRADVDEAIRRLLIEGRLVADYDARSPARKGRQGRAVWLPGKANSAVGFTQAPGTGSRSLTFSQRKAASVEDVRRAARAATPAPGRYAGVKLEK